MPPLTVSPRSPCSCPSCVALRTASIGVLAAHRFPAPHTRAAEELAEVERLGLEYRAKLEVNRASH